MIQAYALAAPGARWGLFKRGVGGEVVVMLPANSARCLRQLWQTAGPTQRYHSARRIVCQSDGAAETCFARAPGYVRR